MVLRLFFIALLVIAVAGCAGTPDSEVLLYADFEADTPNTPPDYSLPGEPEGDRLDWNGPNTGDPLPVRVMRKPATEADSASQRVRILTASTPVDGRLSFIPNREVAVDSVYTIQWEGELDAQPVSNAGVRLSVLLGPSHETVHATFGMLLKPARSDSLGFHVEAYLLDGFGGRGELIGRLVNSQPHTFTVTVNLTERTFIILGGNAGSVRTGPVSFSTGSDPLSAPILRASFDNVTAGITSYYFEFVRITKLR